MRPYNLNKRILQQTRKGIRFNNEIIKSLKEKRKREYTSEMYGYKALTNEIRKMKRYNKKMKSF